MATLTILASENYRDGTPPIPANVTNIIFNTAATSTAQFSSSQFGPGLIANNVVIAGDSQSSYIYVFVSPGASFSAAQWTFSNWDASLASSDYILLSGDSGAETIAGSSKGETIYGDEGADKLSGGDGNDSFGYANQDAAPGETIDGGPGNDSIFIYGSATGNVNDFSSVTITAVERLDFDNDGPQTAIFNASQLGEGGILSIESRSTANQSIIVNGSNVDLSPLSFLDWAAANKTITINGTGGLLNILRGSDKDDVINGVDSALNVMRGGGGKDILNGAAGIDSADFRDKTAPVVVFLNGAIDVVATVGGAAEDILSQVEGLFGGSAADTLMGDGNGNVLQGEGGADNLFSHSFNPDGTMKAAAGNDTLNGGDGDDGLFGGDGVDSMNGGEGNDGMVGGAGGDTMNGDAGGDFLFGGRFTTGGAFAANSGADILNGGAGKDGLYGFDGADTINGDGDNDYIEGGEGDDIINGGADSDFVLGQDGADTLNGGIGFDYLYGAAGADTFIFRKSDSADWILDFSAAQGDKLRLLDFGFANFAAIPLVDLSSPGNPAVQMTFIENGNVDQLTIFGATLAQLNAGNVLVA